MSGNSAFKRKGSLLKGALSYLLLTMLVMTTTSVSAAAPGESIRVLILFFPASSQTETVPQAVQAAGGHVTHLFPTVGLIATLPDPAPATVANSPAVAAIFSQPVNVAQITTYGPAAQQVAAVWNSLLAPPPADDLSGASHPEEHRDVKIAPDLPENGDLSLSGVSVRPGYYETSAFMAGTVAVGLILLESDGSIDPSTEDWTTAEKQLVFNEIVNATNWWAQAEPRANLTFVYEDHYTNPLPTGVEPINRPTFSLTGYDERTWIGDAMDTLGFAGSHYFSSVRDYNNYLRTAYQTDWAFTIFVVDSSADSDNRFADGYFAYAYLGGPYMVLTYGNNGYGPNNMDAVAAHEIGHIFNALDQYAAAGMGCTLKSGYLDVQNQNSQYGSCSSNADSLMRGQVFPYTTHALDAFAAGQIGWRDSDGDNVLDPLDTALPISIGSATVEGASLTVSGQAEITPYPSPSLLKSDITINNLTAIQYRINNQCWEQATLAGEFGDASAEFQFSIQGLPQGTHTLEVVATDSAGNTSATPATTQFSISQAAGDGINTELYLPDDTPDAGRPVTIRGLATHKTAGATVTTVEYRVNCGAWQAATAEDGAFNDSSEAFYFTFEALAQAETSLLLEARAADNAGYQEQTPASQNLPVGANPQPVSQVFIPIVMK